MSDKVTNIAEIGAEQATNAAGAAAPITSPEAAGGAAEGNAGVYTHKFKRPFEHSGVKYTELTFDFEHLTGRDMVAIDAEMQASGEMLMAAETSRSCQSKIAARAAGIGADVVEAMPLGDFNRITNAVRAFLIETGF